MCDSGTAYYCSEVLENGCQTDGQGDLYRGIAALMLNPAADLKRRNTPAENAHLGLNRFIQELIK